MTDGVAKRGDRDAPAWAALLAAHALWRAGETAPGMLAAAAASVGMSQEAFGHVVAFHARIVARAVDEPLILCRGVSCRLHGAEAFHSTLRATLGAAGILGKVVEVHCLSQCDHGPNVKLGDHVLCSGTGCVVHDQRPWRPVTAGPKPIEAPSPQANP
jgi:NADH:ubiquinone oxidoreductase subunit E